jgi:hypothetical protein
VDDAVWEYFRSNVLGALSDDEAARVRQSLQGDLPRAQELCDCGAARVAEGIGAAVAYSTFEEAAERFAQLLLQGDALALSAGPAGTPPHLSADQVRKIAAMLTPDHGLDVPEFRQRLTAAIFGVEEPRPELTTSLWPPPGEHPRYNPRPFARHMRAAIKELRLGLELDPDVTEVEAAEVERAARAMVDRFLAATVVSQSRRSTRGTEARTATRPRFAQAAYEILTEVRPDLTAHERARLAMRIAEAAGTEEAPTHRDSAEADEARVERFERRRRRTQGPNNS